ncbi:hypothetical protein [Sporosarcina psychrophila]|uniref:hypothetical protein n=1 Tax=Sporosarcina psychrophila TaxID=1476 RepID=UPI00078B3718|nr:hypothetical protein [Sporosarcina psychrophila]AMQ07118.1 hypothetical protein AZE41_14935 [Sporosarcina psychrophila]
MSTELLWRAEQGIFRSEEISSANRLFIAITRTAKRIIKRLTSRGSLSNVTFRKNNLPPIVTELMASQKIEGILEEGKNFALVLMMQKSLF